MPLRFPLLVASAGALGAGLMLMFALPTAGSSRVTSSDEVVMATDDLQERPTRTIPLMRVPAVEADQPILMHPDEGLCGTAHLWPVAFFYDDFIDSIGSHYHGWEPPAGPPFYACCGGPCAVFDGLHSVK
ncbi:MAG: hypothetical protein Kow0010_10050 [Dehalococcoidia bacterium]